MAVDRIGTGQDAGAENIEEESPSKRRPLLPDRPGVGGFASRAESRAIAAAVNKDAGTAHDWATDEAMPSTATSGEGVSDDEVHAVDVEDSGVERSILDRLRQVAAKLERDDTSKELTSIIDRPAFQDRGIDPRKVPDRYGNPLECPDGTRTPLFDGEPVREQTRQGRLGDCGIIATLGAVAAHCPEAITDSIQETEDGNFEVRLHEAKYSMSRMRYEATGRIVKLAVTPDLPIFDNAPHRPAFADSTSTGVAWSPILEKAIAGIDQIWDDERRDKWTERWKVQDDDRDAPEGYVRLNQGSVPDDRAELLTQLTGRPAVTREFPVGYDYRGHGGDKQLLDDFRNQLNENKPILVGTKSRGANDSPLPKELQESHAYEVTRIDERNMIHLRNPWNELHPEALTIGEFRANIRPRYSTLE